MIYRRHTGFNPGAGFLPVARRRHVAVVDEHHAPAVAVDHRRRGPSTNTSPRSSTAPVPAAPSSVATRPSCRPPSNGAAVRRRPLVDHAVDVRSCRCRRSRPSPTSRRPPSTGAGRCHRPRRRRRTPRQRRSRRSRASSTYGAGAVDHRRRCRRPPRSPRSPHVAAGRRRLSRSSITAASPSASPTSSPSNVAARRRSRRTSPLGGRNRPG